MTLRQLRRVASECAFLAIAERKSQLLASIQVQRTKVSFSSSRTLEAQAVEAAKFELGQEDRSGGSTDIDQGSS